MTLPVADAASATDSRSLGIPLAILVALGAFCVPMLVGPFEINGDTSWLIHVSERMLAGERAYVDIIETNPPMSILLYLPAAWLGGISGIMAERLVYGQTGLIAFVSILLSVQIARRHLGLVGQPVWLLLTAMGVAFLLVPSRTFTQREHLATMLVLPVIFCLAARAEGARPHLSLGLACGLLAGLAACIKPHFALAVALPAAFAAIRRREWQALLAPELVCAAAVALGYVALVLLAFPAFFDLPLFLVANTYMLYAYGWADYLTDPPAIILLATLLLVGLTMGFAWQHAAVVTTGLGATAFALAFVAQGKGFAYHLYPVAALALIVGALASMRLAAITGGVLAAALAGCAMLSAVYSHHYPRTDDLRRAIVELKEQPSIIIFSYDIAVSFPLVRQIGGVWASRLVSTWVSISAGHALRRGLSPEQRVLTQRAVQLEQEGFAEDIARRKPDVLVFDDARARDHMRSNPAFSTAFDGHYTPAGTAQNGRFLLYRRQGP